MADRVKSGIPGLDDVIGGGFVRGSLILLTGTTGTGKTVMASQYIYNALARYKENCVYISFEERAEDIKRNMANFGWNFEEYERNGNLIFVKYDPFHMEDIYGLIENHIRDVGATRVVLDSITGLGLNVRDPSDLRTAIFNIGRILKKLGCTSLLTSETPSDNHLVLSRYGVEEYVADDVIVLYYIPVDTEFRRAMTVWKMRGSEHSKKIHPFRITEKGITIYPHEETALKLERG
ncbi:MAG: AAA family ATPase [Candidatus Aenigmatarchaeota archaeon]|nr:MAG: AAA family ATPase [Candidatus Aenigmarchaeota archaeon]